MPPCKSKTNGTITPETLEAIRQEYETFLSELESLVVQAIASNKWTNVYRHIANNTNISEASAVSLDGSSADAQTIEANESNGVKQS